MKYVIGITVLFISAIFLLDCHGEKTDSETLSVGRNKEAREDSTKLATALVAQSKIEYSVSPLIETEPVKEDPTEDAADDPAIWYNDKSPDQSIIFGTNKKSGVHAYDLNGEDLSFYPFGKVNNIDVRQKVLVGSKEIDILGGSNRSDNSIILYSIDSVGNLNNLHNENYFIDTTDIDEVYGFCMYRGQDHRGYAIVNGKNGKINQYLIKEADQSVTLELTNTWKLDSQPEGMVADDELGDLYIGEEEKGIWKLSLISSETPISILSDSQKENNPAIEYDIEGLSIYYGNEEKDGFLLASIQGSFSYAVFDRITNHYLGSFIIGNSEKLNIDGVEETDGLDISAASFTDNLDSGILVVQDGFNYSDSAMVGQNFKIIPLEEVIAVIKQFRSKSSIL